MTTGTEDTDLGLLRLELDACRTEIDRLRNETRPVSEVGRPAGPWRLPAEETEGLYPDLVVADGRVSGSITVGRSRLPLWAISTTAIRNGWDVVEYGWEPGKNYGYTASDFAAFIADLLEMRGEFGRLLLVLADAERCEHLRAAHGAAWWETKRHRKRVGDQLRRCIAALGADDTTTARRT